LKPFEDKDGYLRYTYRTGGKSYHVAQHRAVAEVFVPNPDKDRYRIVNHLNSNRKDNTPSNLEWTTSSANHCHSIVSGSRKVYGEKHSQSVISEDKAREICTLISQGFTNKSIEDIVGVPRHYVLNIKSGKSWRSVSKDFSFVVKREDTFSLATYKWVKHQKEKGMTGEQILQLSKDLNFEKLSNIISILDKEECND
jgi:hypothetical protein